VRRAHREDRSACLLHTQRTLRKEKPSDQQLTCGLTLEHRRFA